MTDGCSGDQQWRVGLCPKAGDRCGCYTTHVGTIPRTTLDGVDAADAEAVMAVQEAVDSVEAVGARETQVVQAARAVEITDSLADAITATTVRVSGLGDVADRMSTTTHT